MLSVLAEKSKMNGVANLFLLAQLQRKMNSAHKWLGEQIV